MTFRNDTNPPAHPRKRRRILSSSAPSISRLRRELHGQHPAVPPPRPPDPDLPPLPIATLAGSHELQHYTILGERPTYPFHLVTIPSTFSAAAAHSPCSPTSIHYFSLTPLSLRRAHITTHPPPPPGFFVHAAYTAWEKPRDVLVQVLSLRRHSVFAVPPAAGFFEMTVGVESFDPVWDAMVQLRYGTQVVTISATEPPLAVCFGDVTGDDTAAVKVLFRDRLVLYEPFGGRAEGGALGRGRGSAYWSPLDRRLVAVEDESDVRSSSGSEEFPPPLRPAGAFTADTGGTSDTAPPDTVTETPADPSPSPSPSPSSIPDFVLTAHPSHRPRLRTLSLTSLASRFLLSSRLKPVFASHAPSFRNAHAAFIKTRRSRRTKPGIIPPRANTVLAFGATETNTRLYHVFLFTLALPCPSSSSSSSSPPSSPSTNTTPAPSSAQAYHPRISIVKAKAFTSLDTFSWEAMMGPTFTTSPSSFSSSSSASDETGACDAPTGVDTHQLLQRAVVQLGIRPECVQEAGHECELDCDGAGEDVEVLQRYDLVERESLSEIVLRENGVVLKGWGWAAEREG